VRDVLIGAVPLLFEQREWYATPALLGATAYAVAWSAELTSPPVTWGCALLVMVLRILALRRGWQVPAPPPSPH
jgi:uncharacterized membrane protein YeiH